PRDPDRRPRTSRVRHDRIHRRRHTMMLGWIAEELEALERDGLLREVRTVATAATPEVEIDGRSVVLACSNNYLGLAGDARVEAASASAARRWGAGSGASRL